MSDDTNYHTRDFLTPKGTSGGSIEVFSGITHPHTDLDRPYACRYLRLGDCRNSVQINLRCPEAIDKLRIIKKHVDDMLRFLEEEKATLQDWRPSR